MGNENTIKEKLLDDKRVVEEIRRHLWFESEKAGHDIGFDRAKEDWLKKFSKAWMEYNMPEDLTRTKKTSKTTAKKKTSSHKTSTKRRRAKSYLK